MFQLLFRICRKAGTCQTEAVIIFLMGQKILMFSISGKIAVYVYFNEYSHK
jgi:hypothetical protein